MKKFKVVLIGLEAVAFAVTMWYIPIVLDPIFVKLFTR